jgi:hypothetical protein
MKQSDKTESILENIVCFRLMKEESNIIRNICLAKKISISDFIRTSLQKELSRHPFTKFEENNFSTIE